MTVTRNFGAACAPLVAAGFNPAWLLPAAPFGAKLKAGSTLHYDNLPKVQGRYHPGNGTWSGRHTGYDNGKAALSFGRAPEKIEDEASWPTDGIHIVGHEAVLFDVDLDDSDGAEIAMLAIVQVLGISRVRAAPRRVRDNAPHRASLVFAASEPGSVPGSRIAFRRSVDEKSARECVEWRGAKTYWVSGGSMHPSGARFKFQNRRGGEWNPGNGPLDWKRSDLPAITAEESQNVLKRFGELIEARGWVICTAAIAGGGNAGPKIRLHRRAPVVAPDLFRRVLAEIECDRDTMGGNDEAVRVYATFYAALGSAFAEVRSEIEAWGAGYDGDENWLATLLANIEADGVSAKEGGFANWVKTHGSAELADEVQAHVDRGRMLEAFAGIEEDEEDRTRAAAALNPETGKRRWLASRVMLEASRAAAADVELPFEPATTVAEWRQRAGAVKRSPPIINGFVYPGIAHGVIAAPGVGKSLMTAHAVMCGTYGVDPFGGVVGASPCHVIALFGEDSDPVTYARFEAARIHHAPDAADDPNLVFGVFANTSLELVALDEKTRRTSGTPTRDLLKVCDLLEVIIERHRRGKSNQPVALIFDMLRNTFFGNENERWQVDAVFRVYKALMTRVEESGGPPMGILFTHHMTKAVARSGPTGAGFSAAGSIGIEGNSRLITEVTVEGSDLIKARVTKANDGRTGALRHWRKMPAEVDGHPVVYLQHVPSAQLGPNPFALADWVARLHRFASRKDAPVISYSKKPARGTITLADALQRAGCPSDHPGEVEAEAVRCGAFSKGRVVNKGHNIDAANCLKPVPSWVAPEVDDDLVGQVGMVARA